MPKAVDFFSRPMLRSPMRGGGNARDDVHGYRLTTPALRKQIAAAVAGAIVLLLSFDVHAQSCADFPTSAHAGTVSPPSGGFPESATTTFCTQWFTALDPQKKMMAEHELLHALGYILNPNSRYMLDHIPYYQPDVVVCFNDNFGNCIDQVEHVSTGFANDFNLHSIDRTDLMYFQINPSNETATISYNDAMILDTAYDWGHLLENGTRIGYQ